MDEDKTILVADRNPNIRQLIRRELASCGYRIKLVRNGKELLNALYGMPPVHLLILDPGFPGIESKDTVRKIVDRIPQLPVVLYCLGDNDRCGVFGAAEVFHVDKDDPSIDSLKTTIRTIFAAPAPLRRLRPGVRRTPSADQV